MQAGWEKSVMADLQEEHRLSVTFLWLSAATSASGEPAHFGVSLHLE